MSTKLLTLDNHLKRLQEEEYNVEIRSNHLLVHDVPYLNERHEAKYGTIVSTLEVNGDVIISPLTQHVVFFTGEQPFKNDGSKFTFASPVTPYDIIPGLKVYFQFSTKPSPDRGYDNYYDKMTRYITLLSNEAMAVDSNVTPKTYATIHDNDVDSVFRYRDTASGRAGISAINAKLSSHKVAIVGLGGTGSYILDLIAKTPVREIHIYDGDEFLQHNAFRAPGAASIKDLNRSKKVHYYFRIYSNMRYGIIPHSHHVDESCIDLLKAVDFVFLSIDRNPIKRVIIDKLVSLNIPFIDCGMGVSKANEKLRGTIRITSCTPSKTDHLSTRIKYDNQSENEYETNIQVADLNALNAVFAVIKWKKMCRFYNDGCQEHHMTYSVSSNIIANEDSLETQS
jgi:tRNA A37 threonylcarbamoyladenosine dehydratase